MSVSTVLFVKVYNAYSGAVKLSQVTSSKTTTAKKTAGLVLCSGYCCVKLTWFLHSLTGNFYQGNKGDFVFLGVLWLVGGRHLSGVGQSPGCGLLPGVRRAVLCVLPPVGARIPHVVWGTERKWKQPDGENVCSEEQVLHCFVIRCSGLCFTTWTFCFLLRYRFKVLDLSCSLIPVEYWMLCIRMQLFWSLTN